VLNGRIPGKVASDNSIFRLVALKIGLQKKPILAAKRKICYRMTPDARIAQAPNRTNE
jgi:hypothetical protein